MGIRTRFTLCVVGSAFTVYPGCCASHLPASHPLWSKQPSCFSWTAPAVPHWSLCFQPGHPPFSGEQQEGLFRNMTQALSVLSLFQTSWLPLKGKSELSHYFSPDLCSKHASFFCPSSPSGRLLPQGLCTCCFLLLLQLISVPPLPFKSLFKF